VKDVEELPVEQAVKEKKWSGWEPARERSVRIVVKSRKEGDT
jgi:hypothetical protein